LAGLRFIELNHAGGPRGWDVLRYKLQGEVLSTTDFMCSLLIISCGQTLY